MSMLSVGFLRDFADVTSLRRLFAFWQVNEISGSDAIGTECARARNVYDRETISSAEIHVLVRHRTPIFMGEGASVLVQIFKRPFDHEEDFAVFDEHESVNGTRRFVHDVTAAGDPVVLEVVPGSAESEGED